MAKKFLTWLLIFIGITLVLQSFQKPEEIVKLDVDDFVISTTEDEYNVGEPVIVNIQNNLDKVISLASQCPSSPLKTERYKNGVWELLSAEKGEYISCTGVDPVDSEKSVFTQPEFFSFPPAETTVIDYSPWKEELFSEIGQYRITLMVTVDELEKSFPVEFEMGNRGFFSSITYNLFFRPIFNFLLYLTSILPGYNFGLAVVLLTVIIRLLLLAPNQKALKSQKNMMKIQPEIDAIKKKYKGDQQKISTETMELWKKHKVSPVGGCLPMLLQMPILIALFYVVKTGFSPYQSHMIYDFMTNVDLSLVNTDFFGILDLEVVNATWLPVLVGLLQFGQMKLSFSRKKVHAEVTAFGEEIIDIEDPTDTEKKKNKKEKKKNDPANPMQAMSKTMVYFMPLMIAFMVASLPSGVGLYMFVSTIFGVGQQFFINRSS